MNFFGASEWQVREAQKLRSDSGLLSTPPRKVGRPVSEEIKCSVRQFYEDYSVTYCFPGKKGRTTGPTKAPAPA